VRTAREAKREWYAVHGVVEHPASGPRVLVYTRDDAVGGINNAEIAALIEKPVTQRVAKPRLSNQLPHSRPRSPEARATGRSTAVVMASALPTTIKRFRARVAAV
jgi:hypothetical protein